ncbi:MAG: GNAT family N-acetyltransferase [Sphingomonadales bacterium]
MNPSPYTIREASFQDIDLIKELCKQVWPATYAPILDKGQLDYMMEWMYSSASLERQIKEGCQFLLLYSKDKPVGYASYQLLHDQQYKLNKLYVLPALQGQGAGRYFLSHIHEKIKAQQGQFIELQVNRQNKARYFYEAMGYTIREEVDIAVGNGYYMNDYIMVFALN